MNHPLELITIYKAASNAYREAVDALHLTKESNVLNSHESSGFYKFIRRKLNRSSSIPPLFHPADHTPITDPGDEATLFNEYFCSVFTADDGVTPDFPNRLSSSTTPIVSVFFTHGSVLLNSKNSKNHNPLTLTHFLQLSSVIVLINLLHPFLLSTTLSLISLYFLLIGKNHLLSLSIKKAHTIIHPTTDLFLLLVLVARSWNPSSMTSFQTSYFQTTYYPNNNMVSSKTGLLLLVFSLL